MVRSGFPYHGYKELLAEGKKPLKFEKDSKFSYRMTTVNLLLEDSEMITVRLSDYPVFRPGR